MGSAEKNRRETGAQKLEPHPEIRRRNPVHTGDRGDEPKEPYGLAEGSHDRGPATRNYGEQAPADDAGNAAEAATPRHEKRPL